ncbi:MAG TPA: YhfG family protein [Duganella sp.]|uniref:YhfG family protein n=1 Tax=Duganella sp. TaxID=1904440 RepID=UPI002ED4DD15
MLTNEMKRKIFMKLRMENYRASLRLEGLVQRPVATDKPAVASAVTTPKAKRG